VSLPEFQLIKVMATMTLTPFLTTIYMTVVPFLSNIYALNSFKSETIMAPLLMDNCDWLFRNALDTETLCNQCSGVSLIYSKISDYKLFNLIEM
jgi:hypothetical protein